MTSEPRLEFISEPLQPVAETADPSAMAAGEPGLPRAFIWRGRRLRVEAVLRTWRETGKDTHKSTEVYVRKHGYEVRFASLGVARIYFERQPRGRSRSRWWLYGLQRGEETPQRDDLPDVD